MVARNFAVAFQLNEEMENELLGLVYENLKNYHEQFQSEFADQTEKLEDDSNKSEAS